MAKSLRAITEKYKIRPLNDPSFSPVPLSNPDVEEDEEKLRARTRNLSYEVPASEWRPILNHGEPTYRPRRFIDGSLFTRTVAVFTVEGKRRPAILACVGALSLEVKGRRLIRSKDSLEFETVLCMHSNGIPPEDLQEMAYSLKSIGVHLLHPETQELKIDFEILRRSCHNLAKQRMENAERRVLLSQPTVPTLVDGLLERRLVTVASHSLPAVGVVKRQMQHYLPNAHIGLLYELKPGERTPAFLMETEHANIISWYLRLSGSESTSPNYGVVRLAVTQEYLEQYFQGREERTAELSAL